MFEFIHREYARLLPKIPEEFDAQSFRISFVATTDKAEYPIAIYFTVAIVVQKLGEMKSQGRNPSLATMSLIDAVYKGFARLSQKEDEERQRQRKWQEEAAQEKAARQSLLDCAPQEIAEMADGTAALPLGVTMDMVEARARKIAIETAREMRDLELEAAIAPMFLSEYERQKFAGRCVSEIGSRRLLHEILDRHHENWPAGRDDYTILLQIWKLCARHRVVKDVVTEFFDGNNSSTREERTFERLQAIAPDVIDKVRQAKAKVRAEEKRLQQAETDARIRALPPVRGYMPVRDWSKTTSPY